jgi:nitrate reductase (NAD(P)H)
LVCRRAVIGAYTPLSDADEKGRLRILIKVYYDTPERKGGRMTQALNAIPAGHFVDLKGPVGKFEYLGQGRVSISGQTRHIRRFIMVCGGSGITPIFQVLRAVLKDPEDKTTCLVLDGNREESDILCRGDLDMLARTHPERFQLTHTLTKPSPAWAGRRGRMDEAFLSSEVSPPPHLGGNDQMVLICGPEPMEHTVHDVFLRMGWSEDDLLFF